jgi:subtilisin family serine protease
MILSVMTSTLVTNFSSASAKPALQTQAGAFVPGQLVVGFEDGLAAQATAAQASALAGTVGAQVLKTSGSVALLGFDPASDVAGLATQVAGQTGVKFAEPNYLYNIPEVEAASFSQGQQPEVVIRKTPAEARGEMSGKDYYEVPLSALKAMTTRSGTTIKAVYPNDPYLWWGGWDTVGASMVAPNLTASANVCVIDSGVDYLHPDLAVRMIKGYDFANDDLDPMDDNGHGTHVAGVIAAVQGNAIGLAGVSTGKVVAVKALNAQGSGTNFDISRAIEYCANRLDVRVISMSLGGPGSQDLADKVAYAVNTKGKLVVAAAGNDTTSATTGAFPAAYALTFPGKVLAVAASGKFTGPNLDYWCQAGYSNFGSWVSVVAPGTDIYSTTPYDKPFYMGFYDSVPGRYGSLSGTSMATPYVAAAAARRWGYKPLISNFDLGQAVANSGAEVNADGTCWDASMTGKRMVNVAALLDRGAVFASAYDAVTGLPLNGAQILAVKSGLTVGSGIIAPVVTMGVSTFTATTDIINLPAGPGYQAKIFKAGYTAVVQNAFQHGWLYNVFAGYWSDAGTAAVPPKVGNFATVLQWDTVNRGDFPVHQASLHNFWDLDLNLWVPPANPFVVGVEGDGIGTMLSNPFANLRREGGFTDPLQVETIVFKNRTGPGVVANAGAPFYLGAYTPMVTDWGQIIDHDGDGCGNNYGNSYSSTYNPASIPACATGSAGIPLLGSYLIPYMYVWKDGVIKSFVDSTAGNGYAYWPANGAGNKHWWKPVVVSTSAPLSLPTYNPVNLFSDTRAGLAPYAGLDLKSTSSTFKK